MDVLARASALGAAEAIPLAPSALPETWPTLSRDPRELMPEAKTVILLVTPYQNFAWRPDEPRVDAFYLQFQRARDIALALAAEMRAEGYQALGNPAIPFKPLAAAAGFAFGRNCITGSREYGTRYALQCVLTDAELPAQSLSFGGARPLARACGRCRACVHACPTGALVGNGQLRPELCLRNQSYSEVVPEEFREKLGTSLIGCDICQTVCPRNAILRDEEPPEALRAALRLSELLSGRYEALVPFIGANYARRRRVQARAAIIAGNLSEKSALPLLEELAARGESPVKEHAQWALARACF